LYKFLGGLHGFLMDLHLNRMICNYIIYRST